MKYIATVNEKEYIIEIDRDDEVVVNGQTYAIDFQELTEGGILSLLLNNRSLEGLVDMQDEYMDVLILGGLYEVKVQDERVYRLMQARGEAGGVTGDVIVTSPMPGLIVATPVAQGAQVKKGDKVVVLESMKMENELRSPRDGVVHRLHVTAGASVEKGQPLVTIGDE
jgi:biotin carboxyl carrier protein